MFTKVISTVRWRIKSKISFEHAVKGIHILRNSMISTHNVYKGYQQTTLADRELKDII